LEPTSIVVEAVTVCLAADPGVDRHDRVTGCATGLENVAACFWRSPLVEHVSPHVHAAAHKTAGSGIGVV